MNLQVSRQNNYKDIDICIVVGNKYYSKLKDKFYLSCTLYPPPLPNTPPPSDKIKSDLQRYIQRCAIDSGCPILVNGSESRKLVQQ